MTIKIPRPTLHNNDNTEDDTRIQNVITAVLDLLVSENWTLDDLCTTTRRVIQQWCDGCNWVDRLKRWRSSGYSETEVRRRARTLLTGWFRCHEETIALVNPTILWGRWLMRMAQGQDSLVKLVQSESGDSLERLAFVFYIECLLLCNRVCVPRVAHILGNHSVVCGIDQVCKGKLSLRVLLQRENLVPGILPVPPLSEGDHLLKSILFATRSLYGSEDELCALTVSLVESDPLAWSVLFAVSGRDMIMFRECVRGATLGQFVDVVIEVIGRAILVIDEVGESTCLHTPRFRKTHRVEPIILMLTSRRDYRPLVLGQHGSRRKS